MWFNTKNGPWNYDAHVNVTPPHVIPGMKCLSVRSHTLVPRGVIGAHDVRVAQ